MTIPSTLGSLRTKIQDMQIGDYIIARYKASSNTTAGVISEVGASIVAELPYAPVANPDGSFYFVKADKGLLIADRNVHLVSATAFDTNGAFYNGMSGYDMGINMTSPTVITANLKYSKVINGNTVVISATSYFNTNYEAYRCWGNTGGTDGDRWLSDNNLNNTIKIDLGVETNINSYSIQASTILNAVPKEWKMYGSNDDVTWNQIDYVTTNPANNTANTYTLSQPQKYRYFKWDLINNNGYGGSYKYEITDIKLFKDDFYINGILRVLDGGAVYANQYGLKNDVFNATYGASPVNNEWEKYIVKSDLEGRITVGDDNVWHWSNKESWTINYWNDYASALATARVLRGGTTANKISSSDSSVTTNYYGYRPVFNYQEVI